MRIVVEAQLAASRSGVTARATRVGLVGHGVDTASAISRLQEVTKAWAVSLERGGWLTEALSRTGVAHDVSGDGLDVEVRSSNDPCQPPRMGKPPLTSYPIRAVKG